MDVLFLSPGYPPEMVAFARALAHVGARVAGVGDSHPSSLPAPLRSALADYLQVPSMLDEDDALRRTLAWLGGRRPDRVETNWEPAVLLAARLREALGAPGLSVEDTRVFRDKDAMKARVAAAGLAAVPAVRARTAAEVRAHAARIGFPVLLKPVAGAGSADTLRADDPAELEVALARTAHLTEICVEPFVIAREHTYEALTVDGRPVFESVSTYEPNKLEARQNAWISPIIFCRRGVDDPAIAPGVALGRAAIPALGMRTGFSHMEWFQRADGSAAFGEMACRAPGANMVDLMNYANDVDLFVAWARCIVRGDPGLDLRRPYNAAIVFKRAEGEGRIHRGEGLEPFLRHHGAHVARVDLLPVGAPRRDWRATFLSDGNLVVRHPDAEACWALAHEAAATIRLYAR
jgi:hypothetical protein